VKTQIWSAVSVYVLVAIVKKRLNLDASLYTLLQILSVTLFEKIPIYHALAQDDSKCFTSQITNQLNLFAHRPDSSALSSELIVKYRNPVTVAHDAERWSHSSAGQIVQEL